MHKFDDPHGWRERAEQFCTAAEGTTDPECRRDMLSLAETYEELASRSEARLHKTGQPTTGTMTRTMTRTHHGTPLTSHLRYG